MRIRSEKEAFATLRKIIRRIGGVDVGKRWLEVAVHGLGNRAWFAIAAGNEELIAWLRFPWVTCAGLEASGGYERAIRSALAQRGLSVVAHQPTEVRRLVQIQRLKAKNDRLDARLIASATA